MTKRWMMLVLVGAVGCSTSVEPDEEGDARDDAFLADGKADAFGVSEGSPLADGVLRLVNVASLTELDDAAGLDRRAAENIVAHRDGADGLLGTADDDPYETLTELDATPWVGSRAFGKLVQYANDNGYVNVANAAADPVAAMTHLRQGHRAVELDGGKVLVVGGTGADDAVAEGEVYDPVADSWSLTAAMGMPRTNHTATKLDDGRVLVLGGSGGTSSRGLKHAEIYDPTTDQWSVAPEMKYGRYLHTATKLGDGRVLVLGGQHAPRYYTEPKNEVYDPATESWAPAAAFATGRQEHTATLLPDGRVLVVGGYNQFIKRAVIGIEIWDPATDSFEYFGRLHTPRWAHAIEWLDGNRLLVAGGASDHFESIAEAEIIDIAGGTVTPVASMGAGRKGLTLNRLPSGELVAIGGSERTARGNDAVADVEVFDPNDLTWGVSEPLDAPRENHTATVLPNGTLLIAGGASDWRDLAPSLAWSSSPVQAIANPPALTKTVWTTTPNHGAEFAPTRGQMVYHAGIAKIVAFPGQVEENVPAPTYVWQNDGWREVVGANDGPLPPRFGHSMTYDVARDRLVLFGGQKRQNFDLDDVWEFDGTTWQEIQPAGGVKPPPQYGHRLVYVNHLQKSVLLPGTAPVQAEDYTIWTWDGTKWETLSVSNSGGVFRYRYGYEAVYHEQRQSIVLFSGYGIVDGHPDSWELQGTYWRQIGGAPGARSGHTMTYDSTRGMAVLHGGSKFNRYGGSLGANDTWIFDGSWKQLDIENPPRYAMSRGIIYDPSTDRILATAGTKNLFEIRRVSAPNRAPVLGHIPKQRAHAGEELAIDITASDLDEHAVTLSVDGLPDGATFDASTGQFRWTPRDDQAGIHRVVFRASDGARSDEKEVEIDVEGLRSYAMLPSGLVAMKGTVRMSGSMQEYGGRPARWSTSSATFTVDCSFDGPNPGRVVVNCETRLSSQWPYTRSVRSSGEVAADGTFRTGQVSGRVESLQWDDYQMVVTSFRADTNGNRERWSALGEYTGYLDRR